MPKVENAGMDDANGAIGAFLNSLGIYHKVDYTCDAQGNTTGLYRFGNVPEDSFSRVYYNRLKWYVVTTGSGQSLCYCNSIFFYDDYDEYGNFLGRKVSISDLTEVTSYSLPRTIYYSFSAGGIGFYMDRFIIYDRGCPYWHNFPAIFAGSSEYDSTYFVTQKARWLSWEGIKDLDAYAGSISDYSVVNIDGRYYFKIPGYGILLRGDGSEGSEITQSVFVIPEELADIEYCTGESGEEDAEIFYFDGGLFGVTYEEFIESRKTIDEILPEIIREYPQDFPQVGQAVLEKSKRVISKMTFE